jgi:hypothetical protein
MSIWDNFTLVESGKAECNRKVNKNIECRHYKQTGRSATEVAVDGTVYLGIRLQTFIEPPREGDDTYLKVD